MKQCIICGFITSPEDPWIEQELVVDSISEEGEFEDFVMLVLKCPKCNELQE